MKEKKEEGVGQLPANEQIGNILKSAPEWKRDLLAQLRAVIDGCDEIIYEGVKWKNPATPVVFLSGHTKA